MLREGERPDGTIRVHYSDNTYQSVPLGIESTVGEVIDWCCKRSSRDSANHALYIVAPGSTALRERRLLREDRPLQIQEDCGGAISFKFVIREGAAQAEGDGAPSPS